MPTDLTKIKHMYFIGIGGIGMSALARYFNSGGVSVSGYDRTSTSLTDELINEGMKIHFEDNVSLLVSELRTPNSELLIVYTPAVPATHTELKYFWENNFNLIKRAELLGMLTQNHTTIAVAGTHGKTTTSSLIAHIFNYAGKNCSAFLGGIAKNFNSNLLLSKNKTEKQYMIVEADEYDRSFLNLHPDIAIVTSIDPDHLDIYGSNEKMKDSYQEFVSQIKSGGVFISKRNIDLKSSSRRINYSANESSDYYADNIRIVNHENVFDIKWNGGEVKDVSSQMPGRHNVENTVAAFACAHLSGIEPEVIKEAIKKFEGVVRRFDYRFKSKETVYIDDYAHHPEELRACIESVRELYPGIKITGIFQPHLFSRTRDFAEGFSKSLSLLDRLILLDIYPAREEPIAGVTSELIFNNVSIKDMVMAKKEDVVPMLEKSGTEILLTLGAGDIDQLVKPIAEMLEKKKNLTQDNTNWTPSPEDNKFGLTDKNLINEHEAKGIAVAELFVFGLDSDTHFSTQLLQEIHRIAFEELYDWAGKWRTTQVVVGQLTPPEPSQVLQLMYQFIDNLNYKVAHSVNLQEHIETLAYAHYEFVRIHPFNNGNGRVGRIVMNLVALKFGYQPMELYHREGDSRKIYIDTMKSADKGNLEPLTTLIRKELIAF